MDMDRTTDLVKLNIGCGLRTVAGYVGVDAVPRPAAQIIAPADKIPRPDGSVSEIMAIHLWEHFYKWECDDVIKEWCRLLVPGGKLILELPNLIKCCENIINNYNPSKHPEQFGYWGIFGDPRDKDVYMTHRWGWTPQTLTEYLLAHGFDKVWEEPTQYHPVGRDRRDMRIVARRSQA